MTRLSLARRFSVPQAAISRQLLWHRALLDVPTSCWGFGMGLTRLDRAAARVSEAMMMSGPPSHVIWGRSRSRSRSRAAPTAGYWWRGREGAAHEVGHERRADGRAEPRRCVGTGGRATGGRARAEA